MNKYLEDCPDLPSEINLENWNKSIYYKQQVYKKWKQTYSSIKQGFSEEDNFIAFGDITWRKLWPEICTWVILQGGWDKVDISYKKNIFTAIMMNIEFLRKNKSTEQNIVSSINNNSNFQSQTIQYPWFSDKTILGENCLGQLTPLGILRKGLYAYE